ncbi:MAG TPA: S41 family peptidase [Gemmatimonas sp.]|nr:S41 family peptidase [Gemmatimonas sp.]
MSPSPPMQSLALATLALLLATPVGAQPPASSGIRQWTVGGPGLSDYHVALDSTVARSRRTSVRIASLSGVTEGSVNVSTVDSVQRFAGKRVRLSGYLRASMLSADGGVLFLRANAGSQMLTTVTSQAARVRGTTDWTLVQVELDVPVSATSLMFGVNVTGAGTLWADDLALDSPIEGVISLSDGGLFDFEKVLLKLPAVVTRTTREPPRALDARGLENVVAFTRLLGYVRYFHPADEALRVNWNEFAVHGVRTVESAPTPDSLAATLRALFVSVAPTVAVFRTATAPPAPLAARPVSGPTTGVLMWRHVGVSVDEPRPGLGIYTSRRVLLPPPTPGASTVGPELLALGGHVTKGIVDIAVPDPRQPLRVDIGSGVSAMVPLAVYTALPSLPDSLAKAPPSQRTAVPLSRYDRATRLAAVATTWNTMQHFYPYFDVVQTDWPAALRRALASAATDSGRADFVVTLERLVAALSDGHGNVGNGPSQERLPLTLERVEGQVVVVGVGDSAGAAGIRLGDVVLAVDGVPVNAALRAWEERTPGATPWSVRHRALTRLGSGPVDSTATLRVRDGTSPSAPPRDLRLSRTTSVSVSPAGQPAQIAELQPGVIYVDLARIKDADFQAALPQLQKATGIVFDMRGYPSNGLNTPMILAHLTDSVIHSPRFETPLTVRPDHEGVQFLGGSWSVKPVVPRLSAKIAFLTGAGAISYAETTMGIVEAFKLGVIVGDTTAGTNGNTNPFLLPGGHAVLWTGMRVRKPDGSRHHGVGIAPAVLARRTIMGVAAGRDEVLERALGVVTDAVESRSPSAHKSERPLTRRRPS